MRRSTGLVVASVAAVLLLSQKGVELGGQVGFAGYGRLQSLVVDGLELAHVRRRVVVLLDGLVVAPVPRRYLFGQIAPWPVGTPSTCSRCCSNATVDFGLGEAAR